MNCKLIKKAQETINRYNMLNHKDTVLVGVSSGPDSVCLIHILNDLKSEYDLDLHIAHLNHGFRGEEAEEDAEYVKLLGTSLGIPVHAEYADIPSYIKKSGLSKQAGARKYRYEFFNMVADKVSASRIALGHTADDQVETFLMRLLRGSGSSGLSGIPPVRERIIRPLIEISREEINEFLSEREIRYRIDSSNLTTVYLRNKIRIDLLPYLKKEFNPNIMETLLRNVKVLRDEDLFLDNYVKTIYKDITPPTPPLLRGGMGGWFSPLSSGGGGIRFNISALSLQETAVKRRLIRHAVETIAGEGAVDLSFKHVDDALSLLESERAGEIHLPAGIIVKKDSVNLRVYLKPDEIQPVEFSYQVAVPGDTHIPEAGVTVNTNIIDRQVYENFMKGAITNDNPPLTKGGHGGVFSGEKNISAGMKYEVCFSFDETVLPLIIRNRRSGDLFCPSDMGGHKKKIKEYFIDLKIPAGERNRVPILLSSLGSIMWIIGYRTDERFKVKPSSEKILQVKAFRSAA